MLNLSQEYSVRELDSGAVVFAFSTVLGVVGAILFVLGISPSFTGCSVDLSLTGFGIVLIIIGMVSGATLLR